MTWISLRDECEVLIVEKNTVVLLLVLVLGVGIHPVCDCLPKPLRFIKAHLSTFCDRGGFDKVEEK